jgi:uncharacterized cupin superfamily protein
VTLCHWDEVEPRRPDRRGLGGTWTNLGGAAGSVTVGVHRIHLDAGEVSTPAHVHGADEEIFFVLAGSGLSWQDGKTYEVRTGDCLVHRARAEAHTLRAGGEGLDVLAFGGRTSVGGAHLPQVGVRWLHPAWAEVNQGENPFDREPNLDWPEPGRGAPAVHRQPGRPRGRVRRHGAAFGNVIRERKALGGYMPAMATTVRTSPVHAASTAAHSGVATGPRQNRPDENRGHRREVSDEVQEIARVGVRAADERNGDPDDGRKNEGKSERSESGASTRSPRERVGWPAQRNTHCRQADDKPRADAQ